MALPKIDLSRFTASVENLDVTATPSEVIAAVQETNVVELTDDVAACEEVVDEMGAGIAATGDLTDVAHAMEEALTETGGLTPLEVTLIRRRVESVVAAIPELEDGGSVVASQESFTSNNTRALEVSLESVIETIKKAWDWIVEKLKAMVEAVIKFFTSTLSYTKRLLGKAEDLLKVIKKLPATLVQGIDGATFEIAGAKRFATQDSKEIEQLEVLTKPADVLKMIDLVTEQFKANLSYLNGHAWSPIDDLIVLETYSKRMSTVGKKGANDAEMLEVIQHFSNSIHEYMNLGKNSKGFFRLWEDNSFRSTAGFGGKQALVNKPLPANVPNAGSISPDGISLAYTFVKVSMTEAEYKGESTVAVGLMSKDQMAKGADHVVDSCNVSIKFIESLEKDAKEIEALTKDINELRKEATTMEQMGLSRHSLRSNTMLVGLMAINKKVQLRNVYTKLVIESNVNILQLISKHVAAYVKLAHTPAEKSNAAANGSQLALGNNR